MTKANIGVGLIGFGLAGRAFHAPYIQATPGLSLRAVVSSQVDAVRQAAPQADVVADVTALLERADIDLVVVASPDSFHADHALQALAAGKHVLVDKPFATTLEDARRVEAEASRRGLVLSVFHNRRWDADFLTLRRLIREGELGEVVYFESRFDRWRPEPAPVWKEAREGGAWLDLGPHLVDQALRLFGQPLAVTADLAALRAGAPAPDYFHVLLRYPNRRVVLQSNKLAADHGLRFIVHGTGGSWIKHGVDPQEGAALAGASPGGEDWGHDTCPGLFTSGDGTVRSQPVQNERGDYPAFWRALALAVSDAGPNPSSASDAIKVMEVLDAGLLSARLGRETPLSSPCSED